MTGVCVMGSAWPHGKGKDIFKADAISVAWNEIRLPDVVLPTKTFTKWPAKPSKCSQWQDLWIWNIQLLIAYTVDFLGGGKHTYGTRDSGFTCWPDRYRRHFGPQSVPGSPSDFDFETQPRNASVRRSSRYCQSIRKTVWDKHVLSVENGMVCLTATWMCSIN